jgi:hypothetical protein
MIDDGGGIQVVTGGFSSLMTPAKSWKWISLDGRYHDLVAQPASFNTSTDYDAAYALALSVIEAGSVDEKRCCSSVANSSKELLRHFWMG